jgi:hypothetical protein
MSTEKKNPGAPAPAEGGDAASIAPKIVEGIDLTGINLFAPEEEGATEESQSGGDGAQGEGQGEGAEVTAEGGEEGAPSAAQGEGVEGAPATAEPKPGSRTFLQLARLERSNRELQAKLKELETRPAAEELTEENAWDVLAKKGIDPQRMVDKLVERAKNPPKPKSPAELEADRLRKDVEELRKRDEAREAEARAEKARAATAQGRANVRTEIDKAAEELPFVAAYAEEAVDSIWDAMVAHYQKTGDALSPMDLAKDLEKFYEERHTKGDAALTKRKKPGTLPPSSRSHQPTGSGRPPAAGPKNLTNRVSAAAAPSERVKPLTEEERIAEATKALRFERSPE